MRASGRTIIRLGLLGALVALLVCVPVFAASNSVPATNAGKDVSSVGPNDMKPSQCSGITVTAKLNGTGNFSGTSAAELITGSANADVTIQGRSGNDCILGGNGDDTIDGGPGTDVCIGGPGTDTFTNCETQIQ